MDEKAKGKKREERGEKKEIGIGERGQALLVG